MTTLSKHLDLIGILQSGPRGPMLKDADGMWWRLIGDLEPPPPNTLVRVVGCRHGAAVVEIHLCRPVE